jgi:hypothetical protein
MADDAGVLGVEGTQILFGNADVLDGSRSGGRLRFGMWLDGRRRIGVEGEYFELDQESIHFVAASNAAGNPILARPFFNINPRDPVTGNPDPPAREDSELVSFPGILAGAVSVDAATELKSGRVRGLWNVCCLQDPCGGPCGLGNSSRLDFLVGYRTLQLDERLTIREDLTSLESDNRGSFDIFDRFETSNEFHGAELGFLWQYVRGRWFAETLGLIGLGNNHQVVVIEGQTVTSPLIGPATTATGGLLAQRSNIGLHSRDDFAVVPELGVTLGYRLTHRLSATLGYTFLYLSRALRPGDQIDLDVNPDFLPPEQVPFTGPLRPALTMDDTDFWAQGWSAGLDYRW